MLEIAAVILAVVVAFIVGTTVTFYLLGRPRRARALVETDWYRRLVDRFMEFDSIEHGIVGLSYALEQAFDRYAAGEAGDPQYELAPLPPRRIEALWAILLGSFTALTQGFTDIFTAIARMFDFLFDRPPTRPRPGHEDLTRSIGREETLDSCSCARIAESKRADLVRRYGPQRARQLERKLCMEISGDCRHRHRCVTFSAAQTEKILK